MSVSTEVNPRLAALTAAGTSVWLDQIRRSLIENGELQRLIDIDSLRGVTANPAIFEKAILGSDDYDDDIRAMAKEGLDAKAMYERIAVTDVQMAADVMRPVWEEQDHDDGFVSLEVDPDLAHDTDGTLEQVRAFWKRLDRPNVFIKIPGTDEGVPAIEEAIYDGINVNVTLLFAVEAYAKVAEAYIRGLERRLDEGKSVDIRSVASFFVSRVDTEADKRLEALGNIELQGTAAVANAQAAYQRFKKIFAGERWDKLAAAGARVQRPLWASTGVKNPHYPETKYVDELVGPHTVNTMPMATLNAAAERSEVRGPTADQDPTEQLEALAQAGIDLDDVTAKLLRDGVKAFEDSLDGLLAGIEEQREGVGPRPSAHHQLGHPRRVGGPDRRAGRKGSRGVRRAARLAQGRHPVGRPRGAGGRRSPGLADDLRADAGARGRPARLRAGVPGGGPRGLRALRHGRLEPRARGDPSELRRHRGGHAPARARLHRPGRGARRRAAGGPREDAVHHLLEVGRDDRDALALQVLPPAGGRRGGGRRGGQALRGRDRPGQPTRDPRPVQRVPPRVRERPGHRRALLGALLLRAGARGLHGRGDRGAAAPLPGGRAELHELRPGHEQLGPLAGDRDGGAGRRRPRQAQLHRVRADLVVRPVGRAAGRREHRQAGQGRPAGGRRADRRRRTPTATTACSPTCATPTSRTRSSTPRSMRWRRPASRC